LTILLTVVFIPPDLLFPRISIAPHIALNKSAYHYLNGSRADKETLLTAAVITLSTDTQRLSECLERPFVGRRLSLAVDDVIVIDRWSVSN